MSKRQKKKTMSVSNRIFYIFNTIFWIVIMFIILYPLYLVVIASVSDPDAIVRGEVIWHPVDFSLIGYKAVFQYSEMLRSYGNSIVYTVVSVIISIFVTLTAAYTLSRPKFAGKGILNFFFIFTMFFNGGLIPTFLVMKDIGLYNTPFIMILMGCVSVWNMMVARTFIQTSIPNELYEAAMLDGASHFNYFFKIIIPLSKTIIAVLIVYYGVAKWNDYFTGLVYLRDRLDGASHFNYFFKIIIPLSKTIIAVLIVYYGVAKWNDYFTGLVYLRDRELLPLQTVLKEILATLQVDKSGDYMVSISENAASINEATRIANVAKYCIIVVATGPVVVLYAFMQKYFEKGVMIGSLKG